MNSLFLMLRFAPVKKFTTQLFEQLRFFNASAAISRPCYDVNNDLYNEKIQTWLCRFFFAILLHISSKTRQECFHLVV